VASKWTSLELTLWSGPASATGGSLTTTVSVSLAVLVSVAESSRTVSPTR
jgi:hypothetical protein